MFKISGYRSGFKEWTDHEKLILPSEFVQKHNADMENVNNFYPVLETSIWQANLLLLTTSAMIVEFSIFPPVKFGLKKRTIK